MDMTDLQIAAKAPDFTFTRPDGSAASLSSLRRGPVVVFFYPRAGSPACTNEVIGFSERCDDFAALGAAVIGVSPDTPAQLARFRTKHDIATSLASDADLAIARAWGVWVEKSMYGRSFMGVERATFLVDAAGSIAAIWRKVKVAGHADQVLAATAMLVGERAQRN